jgi:Lhr-like helicase
MAMHHGSIDRDTRLWVENAIRNEELKVVGVHRASIWGSILRP